MSAAATDWLPITSAPRDGTHILAVIGETIPDLIDVRVAQFITAEEALDMGYHEYGSGAWFVWNDACDWFLIAANRATHWLPLPALSAAA